MSEDGPTQPIERLGRWTPRYSGPAHRGGSGLFRRNGADFEIVGTMAVLGLLAILALVGVIVADLPRSDSPSVSPPGDALPVPPGFSLPPLFPAPPPSAPPVPAPPLPPGSAAGTAQTSAPAETNPTAKDLGPGRPPATSASATAAPSTARLLVGTAVSLEAARQPGHWVRHRNFRARVDPIGSGSGVGDRGDATFLVRSGLARGGLAQRGGCVSLEATNFPHRFLRHQNFAVFLQADDGSALFAADATFCPVPVAGGALVLRSVNFPNRYVTERDSQLYLDPVSAGAALSLSARFPLVSSAALEQLISG